MAGATITDRKKGSQARHLILDEVIKIFSMDPMKMSEGERSLKRELLLKMAPSALPRLNEITGQDGGPVEVSLSVADKNKLNAILDGKEVEQTGDENNDGGKPSPESVSSGE